MKKTTVRFSSGKTDFYFDAKFRDPASFAGTRNLIFITDANIYAAQKRRFGKFPVIVIEPGESNKVQSTADRIIAELIAHNADRQTFLIGVGGGVITDITGYVASVYMRGIGFGFIPTTILAMVDAAIGGKNGIDVGPYKNLVGLIRQPSFLLYDISLLSSLPDPEWINGFAEIIKHACIRDSAMFKLLENHNLGAFRKKKNLLGALIQRNAKIKAAVVKNDEFETGERRLLNFGHTLAHAIETPYGLSHGQAVSIGMMAACRISEQRLKFKQSDRVEALIERYGLPVQFDYDRAAAFEMLKKDKKKISDSMRYILLEKIGKGKVEAIALAELKEYINEL